MNGKRITALLTALILIALALAGCGAKKEPAAETEKTPGAERPTVTDSPGEPEHPALDDKLENGPRVQVAPLAAVTAATSYDEIAALFAEVQTRSWYNGRNDVDFVESDAAAELPAGVTEAPTAAPNGMGANENGTNVQVAGVDEADSLKTDGSYLYVLNPDGFRILRADGANTALLSTVVYEPKGEGWAEPSGLFIGENRLALLFSYSNYGWENEVWINENRCCLAIYDTTDKRNPVLLAEAGQDGYFQTARLLDGVICLVSNQYAGWTDDEQPIIPCVYANGETALLSAGQIYLCPQTETAGFTVVGCYRLDSGEQTDVCAFTDLTDNVYMNGEALYLARTVSNETASEPYAENQYTVTDYVREDQTEIKRVALRDGKLELTASTAVPGRLLNQFSMDVYEGRLRLAATTWRDAYSVYVDEAYGWENQIWYDGARNNRVCVLDEELNELGALEDLVADEQIYAVRFIGEVGYVVTYESIDPVFTIDLSDPTAPKLESALEVPGVSQYLHPFTAGRLFGLGQAVDENAVSEGLQLSMYDVSDPKKVALESRLVLENDWTEALYDHHAVLVSGAQNLIGFAVETYSDDDWGAQYRLFRYENGAFEALGSFPLELGWDARAVALDGCLYFCNSSETQVVSLETLERVAQLSVAEG